MPAMSDYVTLTLEEAFKDVLARLAAAHSLLEHSPKTGAPSDKMFDMMLADYAASIERGRKAFAAYLSHAAEPVGIVDSLIGSQGMFSHAVFKASDVPVGTKLYTQPPEPARDAKDAARWRWIRARLCVTEITGPSGRAKPFADADADDDPSYNAEVDAAADAAMAQESSDAT